jgi:hypothetical protein
MSPVYSTAVHALSLLRHTSVRLVIPLRRYEVQEVRLRTNINDRYTHTHRMIGIGRFVRFQ